MLDVGVNEASGDALFLLQDAAVLDTEARRCIVRRAFPIENGRWNLGPMRPMLDVESLEEHIVVFVAPALALSPAIGIALLLNFGKL